MTASHRSAGLGALADVHRSLIAALRAAADPPRPPATGRPPAEMAAAGTAAAGTAALCGAIREHLSTEDELVWPMLERRAGAAVELAGLLDDHRALYELLDRAETDPRQAVLAELRDLFEEHVTEEERTVFPAALRYLRTEEIEVLAHRLTPRRRATDP